MSQKHLEHESLVHYRMVTWVVPSIINTLSLSRPCGFLQVDSECLNQTSKDMRRLFTACCVVTLKGLQFSEENKAIRMYSLYIFIYIFK